MEPSIFTKIIRGEIPCHKVYEDETVIAFLDVHPLKPGHTLVVPKTQIDHIWDVDTDTYHHLWDVSRVIADKIKEVLQPARVGVVVEGFGVPHTHIHLVPIDTAEDLKGQQDTSSEPDHTALKELAARLVI